MTPVGTSRSRLWISVGLVAVVILGLASRRFQGLFPACLGKYPGDALWTLAVFLSLALLQPRASTVRLAVFAMSISCLVEFSQLYQAPWINTIRDTKPGHIVLGAGFSWFDIIAYGVGVMLGVLLDAIWITRNTKRL